MLEQRYRGLLRLLPASYRAEREEEMVSAFLDGAQRGETGLDDQRPRWTEIASLMALALRLRLRLGGPGATPRAFLWGEAVRRAAVLGLVFWTMVSFQVIMPLLMYDIPAEWLPDGVISGLGDPASPERLRNVLAILAPLLWAASLGALVLGRPPMAKAAAVAALVLPYVLVPPVVLWEDFGWARWACTVLPTTVTVLALMIGFHRDAPPPRLRRGRALCMVALPAAAGILLSLLIIALGSLARGRTIPVGFLVQALTWLDMPGLACISLLTVTVWCVAWRRASGQLSAPVALGGAILTVPAALARAAVLPDAGADSITQTANLVGGLQIAVLMASGITLVVMSARALQAAADGDPAELRGQHG
jgi:hypothetical protein